MLQKGGTQKGERVRGVHYGWVVVACAAVIVLVSSAVRLSFGVLVEPMVREFGWSRSAVSATYGLQFLVMALMSPLAGLLGERFGARRTALLGALLFSAGILLLAPARSLLQVYLSYGLLMGTAMTFFGIPLLTTVTLWFRRRVGMAAGVVMASQSAGSIVVAPLLGWLLETVGWAPSFYLLGTGSALLLFASALPLRDRPEALGLRPYGAEAVQEEPGPPPPAPSEGAFLRRVAGTRLFWLLVFIHFLGCVSHSLPLVHAVSYAVLAGVPAVAAAGILSVISAVTIASRFTLSVVAETFGGRWALLLALLFQTLGILVLYGAGDLWAFYLFAVVFGVGYGGEMVAFPILNRQVWGRAPVGTAYGVQMAGASLGMALGGWMGGVLFDLTGTPFWGITVAAGAGALTLLAILALPGLRRPAPAPARPVTPY